MTRKSPPSQLQMDSRLRSSNFMAEQFRHPREGLRQMHSLASYSAVSSIEPRFYRLAQDGHRRLYSREDVTDSEVAPVTHTPSGTTKQPLKLSLQTPPTNRRHGFKQPPELSLQMPPTNRRFVTLLMLAFAVTISLGMLLQILHTHQSVLEDLLDRLGSVTFPATGISQSSNRIRALEEAVQKLTVRLDDMAQSPKESRIRALEEAVQVQQLSVQRTCLRLINEFTGEQDFALTSVGAKVLHELTTSTELRAWSWLSWLQQPPASLQTPNGVLDGRVRAGDCWDMHGQAGQLGISLPGTVTITHVTIDHIPQVLVSDIERAPKHALLWGVVDGKTNFKKAEGLGTTSILHPPEFHVLLSARQGPPTTAGYHYVPLAYITYDISREDWTQTVPVVQDVAQLEMDFGVVVLEVLDNWGGDSTCLYRVRIHGV